MKKVLESRLFFLMLLSAMFINFTACSDDDNEKTNAEAVAGSYKGSIVVGAAVDTPIPNVTISMATRANYADSITLSFNQIIPPLTEPANVTCPAKVTEVAGVYTITGKGKADVAMEGSNASIPVNVNGTVDGAGNSVMTINVYLGETPLPVIFTGKKQ